MPKNMDGMMLVLMSIKLTRAIGSLTESGGLNNSTINPAKDEIMMTLMTMRVAIIRRSVKELTAKVNDAAKTANTALLPKKRGMSVQLSWMCPRESETPMSSPTHKVM